MGYASTDAFPGVKGDVQVTAYELPHFYEFNVELNGRITVIHEFNSKELSYDEGLSLSATFQKIEEFAFEKCDYSDLSTQTISMSPSADFPVKLSETPQTAAESRYLTEIARRPPQAKFVLILRDIIPA
jgi:hypothetical protein